MFRQTHNDGSYYNEYDDYSSDVESFADSDIDSDDENEWGKMKKISRRRKKLDDVSFNIYTVCICYIHTIRIC